MHTTPRNSPAPISIPKFSSPFSSPRIPSPRLPRSTDSRPANSAPPRSRPKVRPGVLVPLVVVAFLLLSYLPASGPDDASDLAARGYPDAGQTVLSPDEVRFEPSLRSAKQQLGRAGKAGTHLMQALNYRLQGVVGGAGAGGVRGAEVFVEDRGYVHYPAPEVDRDVRHPIGWLIEEAGKKWEGMLARQSKTLEESVAEYRRRYGRAPPKGYELWWKYAVENDVMLKDEYDQINTDLEPFLALPAALVLERSRQMLNHTRYIGEDHMFAVEIKDGKAAVVPGKFDGTSRVFDVVEGLKRIAHWLPDMVIPFTIEDGPGVAVSGEEKAAMVKAAREGRKLTPLEMETAANSTDPSFPLWETTCPPSSPLRQHWRGLSAGTSPSSPSFIGTDHAPALDPCLRPDVRLQHSQTLADGLARTELFPLVSFSKTPLNSDILSTPYEQFYNEVGNDPSWEEKTYNKVVWRGSTTGSWHARGLLWRAAQRPRLVELANSREVEREVYWAEEKEGDVMRTRTVKLAEANKDWFDVAYVGLPLQCNFFPGIDETCQYMKDQFRFKQHMSTDDANQYKYVLDVDGNAWSGRFHKLMSSNAAVLKSTIYPEWWTQRAVPWYHYIPVKVDYSDLHHVASYFIGGPDGQGAHDEAGRRIGAQGQEWAKKHWRLEDMASYQLRLFLELARVFYGEDGSHDYQG